MATFTAAEVAKLREELFQSSPDLSALDIDILQALTALEGLLRNIANGIAARHVAQMVDSLSPTRISEARDEGRREILREIARMDPNMDDMFSEWLHCPFCLTQLDAEGTLDSDEHPHTSDCLWLRAQQATAPVTT